MPARIRQSDRANRVRIADLADPALYPVARPDFTRPFWPGENVMVDGVQLFVRSTPTTAKPPRTAEPALFVHGLGGACTNFTDLADLLAPWFDAEAIDLPGFGRSGPSPDRNYGIHRHARVVIRRIEQTGRGPVHLVGNSMGGAICIVVAATRPDLIRTLTLVSPAVPDLAVHRRVVDPMMPLLLVPGLGRKLMATTAKLTPEVRAARLAQLVFAHPERIPPERAAASAAEIGVRDGMAWSNAAFMASFKGLVRHWLTPGPRSPWQLMKRITAPSLVVWGELDKLVDVGLAPRTARTIPDATLLVLPDVGHVAQMEEPAVTARAILALRERAASASERSSVAT